MLDGTVRYRLVRLTFGPGSSLSLDIGIFTPVSGGPFPAVILQGGTPPGGAVLPRLPQGPNQGGARTCSCWWVPARRRDGRAGVRPLPLPRRRPPAR